MRRRRGFVGEAGEGVGVEVLSSRGRIAGDGINRKHRHTVGQLRNGLDAVWRRTGNQRDSLFTGQAYAADDRRTAARPM